MADKKISIIVQAVVDAARRNLKGVKKDLSDLGDESGTIAQRLKAQGETAKDARLVLEKFGFTADEVKQHLRGAGYEVDSMASSLDAMGTGATIAKGAIIAVGAAFAVAKLAERAIEIADTAAATVALREGFERLTTQSQVDSKLLLQSLKEASRGTISEYELMKQANKAWYLGIAQNVRQYSDLMKIAEVKSKDMGISITQYWERFTSAVASGYPITMRQLGVVIDNTRAYEDYALILGKAADELTNQEQLQARVNAVIADSEPTLRRWEEAEKDAITVTQEFHAVTADLRAEIEERLLPVLIPGIEAMTTALKATQDPMARQQEVLAQLIEETGSLAEAEIQLAKGLYAGGQGFISQEMAAQQAATAILDYKIARMGIDEGIMEDVRAMRMAEKATIDWSGVTDGATRDTEELADAVDKASDVYDKYVRDVEEANYRFGRSVADANFRATQAAETAAFRRYEIERNAAQRYEDDLNKHTRTIQRQWQDLHDALSDIEYDYQQDRKDLLKRSPWWIRQALQKEFAERKRVAASGDSKALEAFDKVLRERIRIIDPVYAQELDELEEQFDRKETVEKREAGQTRRRTERDFQEQERITRRELRDQLEAWRFHAGQRGENERRAMDNLIADNAHRLESLYADTNRRLAVLDVLWKHYGHAHGVSYINQLQHILSSYTPAMPTPVGPAPHTPIPPGYEFPETNPWAAGASLAGMPAGEGAITVSIGNLVVPSSFTPQQGRQFANDVVEALGPRIRKKSR